MRPRRRIEYWIRGEALWFSTNQSDLAREDDFWQTNTLVRNRLRSALRLARRLSKRHGVTMTVERISAEQRAIRKRGRAAYSVTIWDVKERS